MSSPVLPLARGAAGEAVRDLQRRLARAGYDLSGDDAGHLRRAHRGGGAAASRRPGACGRRHLRHPDLGRAGRGRLPARRPAALRAPPDAAGRRRRRPPDPAGRLGFFADRVDGILGPQTAAAINDFQRNAGLTADGICGPDTIAALAPGRTGATRRSVKAGVVEREQLRTGSRRLAGRRILVGQLGGLDALAADRDPGAPGPGRGRRRRGPTPTRPTQAAEANGFEADVYLGPRSARRAGLPLLVLRPARLRVGRRPAAGRAAGRGAPRGARRRRPDAPTRCSCRSSARPGWWPCWCELGPPTRVVEATAAIARAVVRVPRRLGRRTGRGLTALRVELTTAFSTPCGQSPGLSAIRTRRARRSSPGRCARGPRGVAKSITTLPALRAHRHLHPGGRAGPTAAPRARAARAAGPGPAPPVRRRSPVAAPSLGSPERARTASSTSRTDSWSFDRPPGQRLLEGAVRGAEQRPGVAGRQLAVGDQPLDRRRELEEAQGVGDRRAALAHPAATGRRG